MPKEDTDGGEAQQGGEIRHGKKESMVEEWESCGESSSLNLRLMGPTRDLLFVVSLHLSSLRQTWPAICPPHPTLT